ncbi:MAG: UvrD-helicase domain-containing protein [Burkholderiaceae bacterium]|nr:UvrD-helicase domain-containing protein [Burkholderiaceae bacterium]
MNRFLDTLNEQQLAAVTLPPQHALILAGAGSGKTRVLTTRIAWLISTGQVSPQGVLAVTFTNKAAREMNARLGAMLPINTRGMWIGTFHGLCNRMLRAHHRDAALPQTFQILDSADQLAAIKRLLKSLNVDDERYPPRNLQYFVNSAKEQGLRAASVEVVDDYNRRFVELYQAYDDQCQREGVVDFAELMLRSYELLERNELLREHYQHRFRHLLVDEFQDTNLLQYRWLKLLAGSTNAVFAVGDDDQSIYAFRGANVANMATFEREFEVRNLIKLEQNYRSHAHILRCANTLIANNTRRLGKDLWTDAGEGEPVRIYEANTDAQEAQWLIDEVRGLIGEGHARADIAILYRSNAQSRVLEHGLFSAGIPYRVYGGLRFFERAEIKHALAYLRLLENPSDDGAFLRVVNFPARGIGARSVEALTDLAAQNGASLLDAVGALPGAAGVRVRGFVDLLESMRRAAKGLPLPELVESVVEHSGLIEHYRNEREGQERIENLRELVNAAAAFIAEEGIDHALPAGLGLAGGAPAMAGPVIAEDGLPLAAGDIVEIRMPPLAAFLAHASLEAGENQAGEGSDALQLMTVHAAKGLEFDTVFLTGLEEGLFPHENSLSEIDGLEEERRLMYVAITRARERLYLSMSQTRMLHGQTRYSLRSRFIDELPPESLKWLSAGAPGSGWGDYRVGAQPPRGGGMGLPASHRAPASAPGSGFRIGQAVSHARFGEGVILASEGVGTDARVQVNFGPAGVKWLALSVAKLQAA